MKLETKQPQGRKPQGPILTGAPRLGALFWVRVTAPENCRGLTPGLPLTVVPDPRNVAVLRGVLPLGLLEPKGAAWVRSHNRDMSCEFVKYGTDPRRRFQVRIEAA